MVACVKAEDGVNGYIVEVEVGRVLVAVQVLGVVSEVEMVLGHRVTCGEQGRQAASTISEVFWD